MTKIVDRTLVRDIKRIRGDGSREAKFALLEKVSTCAREMSSTSIRETFYDCLRAHGRAVTAICVAATLEARKERLDGWGLSWALEVLALLPANFTQSNREYAVIHDRLHPTRICEYAGAFIRLTTENA